MPITFHWIVQRLQKVDGTFVMNIPKIETKMEFQSFKIIQDIKKVYMGRFFLDLVYSKDHNSENFVRNLFKS